MVYEFVFLANVYMFVWERLVGISVCEWEEEFVCVWERERECVVVVWVRKVCLCVWVCGWAITSLTFSSVTHFWVQMNNVPVYIIGRKFHGQICKRLECGFGSGLSVQLGDLRATGISTFPRQLGKQDLITLYWLSCILREVPDFFHFVWGFGLESGNERHNFLRWLQSYSLISLKNPGPRNLHRKCTITWGSSTSTGALEHWADPFICQSLLYCYAK